MGLGLLTVVLALFVLGKTTNLLNVETLQSTIESLGSSPWALPALVLIFVLAAFMGFPQFVLIGFAVAAFGPWTGALYAWLASLVSGAVTFFTGRFAGEKAVRKYAGKKVNDFASFIGKNAFLASLIVRNVPAGPFLIVNMVFGASRAKFSHFISGMAVGTLPKIALVAFAGQSLFAAVQGNPVIAILAAIAAIAIYAGVALFAKRRLLAQEKNLPSEPAEPVDTGQNISDE